MISTIQKKWDDKIKGTKSALLIIDMLNMLEFPESKKLLKNAIPVAERIAKLKKRFKRKNFPVIYVNDNFGEWQSDWKKIYSKCAHPTCKGSKLAILLKPEFDDYFILKPRHSGFYSTSLEFLLCDLNVKNLVLTGIAGNICVLFTAHDAHTRGYKIRVPKDCIASLSAKANQNAIDQLDAIVGKVTQPAERLRF